ncbi:hypothetical protein FRB90_005079, partial [Tulasnella sp. 427]
PAVSSPAPVQSRRRRGRKNASNTNVADPAPDTLQAKPLTTAPVTSNAVEASSSGASASSAPARSASVTPTVSPPQSLVAAAAARFVAPANTQYVPEPLPSKPARQQLQPAAPFTEAHPHEAPAHPLIDGDAAEPSASGSTPEVNEAEQEDEDVFMDASEELYEDVYDEWHDAAEDDEYSDLPFACGDRACLSCNVNAAPLGHKKPIESKVIASFIRHVMPDRFETPEQVRKRVAPTKAELHPPKENPEVPEGDDWVYTERGTCEPPRWDSGKAVPQKSCLSKKNRYHPYRRAAAHRTFTDIKASLAEALQKRHAQNYEGPNAIAVHDEMSHIEVPGTESFKWEPEYTGPPGAFVEESEQDEDGEMVPPTNNKKRRLEESKEETEEPGACRGRSREGTPTKKPRRYLGRSDEENPGFVTAEPAFEFTFTAPYPSASSSSVPSRPQPPTASTSNEAAGRHARIERRKTRVQFEADPNTLHPKFRVPDSIYLHHRRLRGKSMTKDKAKRTVQRSGLDWTEEELEDALNLKAEWDGMRRTKFDLKACLPSIVTKIRRQEKPDAEWELFGDILDRYEAAYPAIDLAAVRAKHLRPAKKEERGVCNKELTGKIGDHELIGGWYPVREHSAWEGVDDAAWKAWVRSPHYQVTPWEVKRALQNEEHLRKRRMMERMEAMDGGDGDTEVDENEDAMRQAFVAGEGDDAITEGPVLQEPPPLEPIHPGLVMTPEVEARWEARWSTPAALPPTHF